MVAGYSNNNTDINDNSQYYDLCEWTARGILYAALEILLGIGAVFTNSLYIAVLMRKPYLRTFYNYFIGSMAAANIASALLVTPLVLMRCRGLLYSFYGCLAANSLVTTFLTIAILNIFFVDFDRYFSIVHHATYFAVMTRRCTITMIVFTWALGILIGTMPLMGWHNDPAGFRRCYYLRVIDKHYIVFLRFFGIVIPVLLTTAVFHIRIYMSYYSLNRRRMAMFGSLPKVLLSQRKLSQKRLLQNLTVITTVFAVCWVPLHVLDCIRLWSPSTRIHKNLIISAVLLTRVHGVIVPVLFARGQHAFRLAALRIICPCKADKIECESTEFKVRGPSISRKPRIGVSKDGSQDRQRDHLQVETVFTRTLTTSA